MQRYWIYPKEQYICGKIISFPQKFTEISMRSTYERLRQLAEDNGVNLTKACRVANVERSTVERWKKREPQTIQMIQRLEEAIISLGKTDKDEEPCKE